MRDGGFAYWPGACQTVAVSHGYVLHVFKTAVDLKYEVDAGVRERAYDYLRSELAQPPPVNEGWWPAYTAWQTFAVKVLVEGGRNEDSHITRLYGYRDRMPVFALAYLHDALLARGERPVLASPSCDAACRTRSCLRVAARTSTSWPIRTCSGSGTPTSARRPSCWRSSGRRDQTRRCGRWSAG